MWQVQTAPFAQIVRSDGAMRGCSPAGGGEQRLFVAGAPAVEAEPYPLVNDLNFGSTFSDVTLAKTSEKNHAIEITSQFEGAHLSEIS
jgi:hypothetical protein